MSDTNKKVEPVRFEPASTPAVETPGKRDIPTASSQGGADNRWVVYALAGLAVVALLVFFWLPKHVDTGDLAVEAAPPPAVERSKAPATEQASPFADAQAARDRKAAQDILAELLDVQFALEEMSVEQWAPEEFEAAKGLAATGDEQYRQQEFIPAAASYENALAGLQTLIDSAPDVFREQVELGRQALLSDQAEAAVAALELALLIEPDDPEAQALLDRARNLGPLLELLQGASAERDAGNLEEALAMVKEALALDSEHVGAAAQLGSLEREIARRDFNRAMSAGYAALDEGRFDEAERQFKSAQGIMPAATEPQGALTETRTARTQAQIEAYRQRATAAAGREDWVKAAAAYQEILDIDNTVVFARNGLADSKTRAQLDKRLKAALAKPERLSDEGIYRDTRALYQYALGLDRKGPLLREQLAQLDEVLRIALIEVPVLLQSDEQTDVTLYKVAHIGSFRRHQLTLKPGVYTAVGVRRGYRDVRLQFTVDPKQQSQVVEIACTEPI